MDLDTLIRDAARRADRAVLKPDDQARPDPYTPLASTEVSPEQSSVPPLGTALPLNVDLEHFSGRKEPKRDVVNDTVERFHATDIVNAMQNVIATKPLDGDTLKLALKAQKMFGIDLITGARAPEETRTQVHIAEMQRFLDHNPRLAGFLADPTNNNIVRGDLEALQIVVDKLKHIRASEQSQTFTGQFKGMGAEIGLQLSAIGRSIKEQGMVRTELALPLPSISGMGDYVAMEKHDKELKRAEANLTEERKAAISVLENKYDLSNKEEARKFRVERGAIIAEQRLDDLGIPAQRAILHEERKVEAIAREIIRASVDPNSFGRYIRDASIALAGMAPAIGISIASRSPTLGAAVIAAQVYGQRYDEVLLRGGTRLQADAEGMLFALVELVSERIPIKAIIPKKFRHSANATAAELAEQSVKQGLLRSTLKAAGLEGAQELFVEAFDLLYGGIILDENITFSQAIRQLFDAGIIGFTVGGSLKITIGSAGKGLGKLRKSLGSANAAEAHLNNLSAAQKAVEETKTFDTSPETLKALIEEDNGEDGGTVLVDAQTLLDLHQDDSVLSPVEEAAPTIAAQLNLDLGEAETTAQRGGEVEIRVSDLLTLPKDKFDKVAPFVRRTVDGLTAVEAKAALAQREQDIEAITAQMEKEKAENAEARPIYNAIHDQALTAGRTQEEADAVATLYQERYTAIADSMEGVTAEELFLEENVTIRRPKKEPTKEEVAALNQEFITDDSGQPVRAFHGTASDITTFAPSLTGNLGPGFYVTTSTSAAGVFSERAEGKEEGDGGANIMPVFVAASRVLDTDNMSAEEIASLQEAIPDSLEGLRAKYPGYAAFEKGEFEDTGIHADLERFHKDLAKGSFDPGRLAIIMGLEGSDASVSIIGEVMAAAGFDAVSRTSAALKGEPEFKEIVVYKNTQLKSEFNTGAFDETDPNILNQTDTLTGGHTIPDSERKGSPEGEADDARWRSLKPTKTKKGKFIGVPEWVKNAGGLTRLRKLLRSFTEEGLPGRFWYEDSALEALRITNGNYVEAEKFIGLLAIFSPQTGVFPNTGFAIKAYTQWKNGEPVSVKTGDQNAKAQAWLDHGKDWGGRKVNSFYLNLMKELLITADTATMAKLDIPADVVSEIDRVTVDLWVLRAMGYDLDVAGGSEGLAGKYSFTENEIRRLTGILNGELQDGERRWLPHQVQAALWTSIKARYEVPEVKKATIAESVEKGLSDYDPETGKWRAPTQNTPKRVAHMKIWRKHALAASDEDVQKSVENAKGSFGTMLNRIAQNITWEAVPSTSLDLDITSADEDIRRQFTEEAISLLVDDTGHDQLADQLGVPLNLAELGTGGYAGDINTNAVTTLIPIKPAGAFDNSTAILYARIIQYIFKQDAVPIFRAESKTNFSRDYSVTNSSGKPVKSYPTQAEAEADLAARRTKLEGSVKKDGELRAGVQEKLDDLDSWSVKGGPLARGLRVSFKEPLDQASEAAFYQALRKHLGEDAGYSKINGEIVVINFRDDATGLPFMNDQEFAAGIKAMEEADGETLNISKIEEFGSEGTYGPVQDWSADPEGKSLGLALDISGRPDLQSWVRDRREAFEALIERYSGQELAARKEELRLHQETLEQKVGPRPEEIARDIAQLSDEELNNLDLTVEDRASVASTIDNPLPLYQEETAKIAPSEILGELSTVSLPTDEVVLGVLGGFPRYLEAVAKFMGQQRDKLTSGTLTIRDIIKAHAITVGSQGAGAMKVETFTAKTGFVPSAVFVERGMIRPEEAMAMWFGTVNGQAALDAIEAGNLDPALWTELLEWRKAWGDNRLKNMGFLKSLASIGDVTAKVNELGKMAGRGIDVVEDIGLEVQNLGGVGPAKAAFLQHLLGMGEVVTMDAVEINFWLTGKADVKALKGKQKALASATKHSPKGLSLLRDMVMARFQELKDANRLPLPEGINDGVFMHVMHHWLWDRAKGVETTHAGLYEAMTLYQDAGKKGNALSQTGTSPVGPRGSFHQEKNIYGDIANIITLTHNANKSTFLHETGHFFLFQMTKYLNDTRLTKEGRKRLQKDIDTTKKWFRKNATDAWADIQTMATSAKEQAAKDPENFAKKERADRLGAAVAHAKKSGGGVKYMRSVADAFMTGDLQFGTDLEVAYHEMWARGAEKYFGSGIAPTYALQSAYQRFSEWLTGVYANLSSLNVNLDPEISRVFDRLVTTNQAVEDTLESDALAIPEGIKDIASDAEQEALVKLSKRAQAEAKSEVQEKVMALLKREQNAARKEQEAKIKERVTKEVREEPLYAAINIMRKALLPNGETILDEAGNVAPMQINREEFIKEYGVKAARKLPHGVLTKKKAQDKKGNPLGQSAGTIASLAGFQSADAMVSALQDSVTPEAATISARTATAVKEELGEVLSDEEINEVAIEAVANDRQLEVLSAQARILRRLIREPVAKVVTEDVLAEGAPTAAEDKAALEAARQKEGGLTDDVTAPEAASVQMETIAAEEQQKAGAQQRKAQRGAKRKLAEILRGVSMDVIKESARRHIQTLTLRELNPTKYRATADRLGKQYAKAIAGRDYQLAEDLLNQISLNIALAKEGGVAKAKIMKDVARLEAVVNKTDKKLAKSYDTDIINIMRGILFSIEIGRPSKANLSVEAVLDRYEDTDPLAMAELKTQLNEISSNISNVEEGKGKTYQRIPIEDLTEVTNLMNRLLVEARDIVRYKLKGETIHRDEIIGEFKSKSADIANKRKPKGDRGSTAWRRRRRKNREFKAGLFRIELWARWFDNNDNDGPMNKYIVRPVMEAITAYNTAKVKPIKALAELLQSRGRDLYERVNIVAPEFDGWVLRTKGELIHMLLHTGNASNLRKLILGAQKDPANNEPFSFGEEDPVTGELDTTKFDLFIERMFKEGVLTQADVDLVNGIWAIFEDTKEAAQAAHKEMHGYYFTELPSTPSHTPLGMLTGGYVPAIYDEEMTNDVAKHMTADTLATSGKTGMFPTPDAGFTKSRVEYNAPLKMDLTVLPLHLDRVIRFAYIAPEVRRVGRLLLNKQIKDILGNVDASIVNSALLPWLQRSVTQRVAEPSDHGADNFSRWLSRSAGSQTMAGNVVNTAQQFTGLITAAMVVSPKYLAQALFSWRKNGLSNTEYIWSQSPYMRNRMKDSVHDFQNQVSELLAGSENVVFDKLIKTKAWANKHAYFMQQWAQNIIDPITWMAAQRQAMEKGGVYEKAFNKYIGFGIEIAEERAEQAAALYADRVVRDTQSPMQAQDISRVEAGTAGARLFVKFYSYFNNMYNLNRTEFKLAARQIGWKGKPTKYLYIYLVGVFLPAVLAQGVSMATRGEDQDDLQEVDDLLWKLFFWSQIDYVAGMVPYFGTAFRYLKGQFTKEWFDDKLSLSPAISIGEGTIGNILRTIKDVVDEPERATDILTEGKSIKRIMDVLGILLSVPTKWAAKPLSYWRDVEQGKQAPRGVRDIVSGVLTGSDPTKRLLKQ